MILPTKFRDLLSVMIIVLVPLPRGATASSKVAPSNLAMQTNSGRGIRFVVARKGWYLIRSGSGQQTWNDDDTHNVFVNELKDKRLGDGHSLEVALDIIEDAKAPCSSPPCRNIEVVIKEKPEPDKPEEMVEVTVTLAGTGLCPVTGRKADDMLSERGRLVKQLALVVKKRWRSDYGK